MEHVNYKISLANGLNSFCNYVTTSCNYIRKFFVSDVYRARYLVFIDIRRFCWQIWRDVESRLVGMSLPIREFLRNRAMFIHVLRTSEPLTNCRGYRHEGGWLTELPFRETCRDLQRQKPCKGRKGAKDNRGT